MVDVPLVGHKARQCGAPAPRRYCRRVGEGKQETRLLLPLAVVVPKQQHRETSALVSRWAQANPAPNSSEG